MTEGIEPGAIELVSRVDADGALLVFCVFRVFCGDQIRDGLGDAAPGPLHPEPVNQVPPRNTQNTRKEQRVRMETVSLKSAFSDSI